MLQQAPRKAAAHKDSVIASTLITPFLIKHRFSLREKLKFYRRNTACVVENEVFIFM